MPDRARIQGRPTCDMLDERMGRDDLCIFRHAAQQLPANVLRLISSSTYPNHLSLTCTAFSSIAQTLSAFFIAPTTHFELQYTCSEHLTTIELPANSAARMGERALWIG
jgi:hypothetical protein